MDQLRPDGIERPLAHRLPVGEAERARILDAHRLATEAAMSIYRDPSSGLMVMTAVYLTERGYCCSSGCRHCPYEPR